ncbi:riboflavin biosynthesis protein RibF [bacterium]|nr:riboflavin biosynthesis protein RibF [bacterium]
MKIFQNNLLNLKNVVLILGFFDGIHLGHRKVIASAVSYAKEHNLKSVLYTFKQSPAEVLNNKADYIYSRSFNYKLIADLNVDFLIENDFKDLINLSKDEFITNLTNEYAPKAIFSGFNYTFGKNKEGNIEYLNNKANELGYKYFCIESVNIDNKVISSTEIKNFLIKADLESANYSLALPFTIMGKIIKGKQIAQTLGFPTANIEYPEKIIKIPFGVYKAKYETFNAVLNWGIKPTFNNISEPILELHVINFNNNLYDKNISFQILKKIRDEKKFSNTQELKEQINKDIMECSKL